jgi:hypothetical protein
MPPERPPKFDNRTERVYGRLGDSEMGAIKLAIRLGIEIQRSIPEIADDYINGASANELVIKYNIQSKFGIQNLSIAENAVRRALTGYDGNFQFPAIKPYQGLIPDTEKRKQLDKDHKSKTGKKAGKEGKGFHGWTFEQKQAHSRKNVEAAGFVPYSELEKVRIGELAALPEYKYREIKVATKRVAQQINIEFHRNANIRTSEAIVDVLQNLKKAQKAKTK